MEPIARMCRSVWWAFAVSGALALVAAAAALAGAVGISRAVGAWQLTSGVLLFVAAFRAPGGVKSAIPFVGAAIAGLIFGLLGILLATPDVAVSLLATGIFGLVAGAGFLAVARVARDLHVPDGGLFLVAYAAIGAGVVVTTLTVFRLATGQLAAAIGVAVVGGIAIVAALRLRVLPDGAPEVVSNRELRRRERAGRG